MSDFTGLTPDQNIKARVILDNMLKGMSLRESCVAAQNVCSPSTFCRWADQSPELAEQYARARLVYIDRLAEETIEIADNVSEDANSRRVRVDARRWYASKINAKKYGDKLDIGTREDDPLVKALGNLSFDKLAALGKHLSEAAGE